MSTLTKQELQDAAKRAAYDQRISALQAADYSAATSIDDLYSNLSTPEIKLLLATNASFKATQDRLDGKVSTAGSEKLIADFRALTPDDQQRAYAQMSQEDKAIIDADYDAFIAAHQTLSPSQDEIDTAKAAEAAATPTPAVTETPVVQTPVVEEKLYDGVEKQADGTYKLTVDPEDGSSPEVFFGGTQADCFKALRKSKASATRELRRRAKKVEISDALKAMEVEKIQFAPLLEPVILTPDEIFQLTEQLKDPVTVLKATARLRQASITPEECARQNEETIRRRYETQYNTAISWVNSHPEFYNCPENIKYMQDLMGELNWAVTVRNLDKAFQILVEQDVLVKPEPVASVQPVVPPASVVPVTAAPVVTPAPAPASAAPTIQPTTPAAPAGALPAAEKVLRPASSTGMPATRRIEPSTAAPHVPVLTAEEYHAMPTATVRMRYNREPAFKAQVDALIASGKI